LQAKFDALQAQFIALLAAHAKLNQKFPPTSSHPNGQPKPEEKEEGLMDGEKWY
jgi:hypothetical protein